MRRAIIATSLLVTAQVYAAGALFDTPLAAADALLAAVGNDDTEAIVRIFGEEHRDLVDTPDKPGQRATRQAFYQHASQKLTLHRHADDSVWLVIGEDDWPMPIPLVRSGAGWRFDTNEGEQELLRRRIGMNELAAIEAVEAVIDAQLQYAAADPDGDGVREFAQAFVSQVGQKDGLYWKTGAKDVADDSPLSRFVADAEPYLEGRSPADPFRGYYFRILKRQGDAAPGGAFDYLRGGHMVAGFGVLAYPADYGITGIMSFIANHQGHIYERDLGEETLTAAAAIDSFNPEAGWILLND